MCAVVCTIEPMPNPFQYGHHLWMALSLAKTMMVDTHVILTTLGLKRTAMVTLPLLGSSLAALEASQR